MNQIEKTIEKTERFEKIREIIKIMKRIEKIRETIETMDSLVAYPHGNEHCILPEHYDELADDIMKLVNSWCTGPEVPEWKIPTKKDMDEIKRFADENGQIWKKEVIDKLPTVNKNNDYL